MSTRYERSARVQWKKVWLMVGVLVIASLTAGYIWTSKQTVPGSVVSASDIKPLSTVKEPAGQYDVIVVGTDPEGVAAAVSAARNGLKTLLVDGRDRQILGGLMTLGWLNTLDMNHGPVDDPEKNEVLNRGLFMEWYERTGMKSTSFDIADAANAFHAMVSEEPNIDVLLKVKAIEPILSSAGGKSEVTGLEITLSGGSKRTVRTGAVIDATQDADIAAAAGVPYTYGREDLGDKESKMAVTLVFRLKNVTPEVYRQMAKRAWEDGDPNTGASETSIWGYTDMKDYPSPNHDRVAMRALNIGRQANNTVLVNALQIFGIDGTDPESVKEAYEIGKKELPLIVDYMRSKYPELAGIELDAAAPELYVRETRHMIGEYRLTMADVLENRDHWDRIAFGSYPVDIQRLAPEDRGAVVVNPRKYAIPFRSIVPLKVDGLLVVGRAGSFDSLPHGSARVIPVGMATAEAAGAAVKVAKEKGVTFRQMTASREAVALLQDTLNRQGMVLKPYELPEPPYVRHKAYEGLKTAIDLGLAAGGYDNNFMLDDRFNLLVGMQRPQPKKAGSEAAGKLMKGVKPDVLMELPADLELAAKLIAQALEVEAAVGQSLNELLAKGYIKQATIDAVDDKQALTNGEVYMLVKDVHDAMKEEQK